MRANTLNQYLYTGERWNYNQTQDENSGNVILDYFPAGQIKVKVVMSDMRQIIVYSDVNMPLFTQIRNVRDQDGKEILPGKTLQVKAVLPVLNVFGFSDGYQYQMTIPV